MNLALLTRKEKDWLLGKIEVDMDHGTVVTSHDGVVSNHYGERWSSLVKIPPQTWQMSQQNDIANQKQRENLTEKCEMGRVGFEPTTPAMSRRYLNQARPPALYTDFYFHLMAHIYIRRLA